MHDFGAKGLVWFKVEPDGTLASPVAKNFEPTLLAKIGERLQAAPGDLLLIVADDFEVTCKALYGLRNAWGSSSSFTSRARCTFRGWSSFRCSPSTRNLKAGPPCTIRSPCRAQDRELLGSEPGRAARRPMTW